MSIIELATIRAKTGAADAMAAALPGAIALATAHDDCLDIAALRCVERPDEFVLRIEWTSIEAHEAFRGSETFAAYSAQIAAYLDEVVGFAHFAAL